MISQDANILEFPFSGWTNLISLLGFSWDFDARPQEPNHITIVHANGKILDVYSPGIYRLPPLELVEDPIALAKDLYGKYNGVRFVQVLEKSSLLNFIGATQKVDWQSMDYDDYLYSVHQVALQDPVGLYRYPERQLGWKGIPYARIKEYVAALPDPSALVLGIFWNSMPWLVLIALKKEKKIRLITSQEYFAKFEINADYLPSGLEDYDMLIQLVESRLAPVSVSLVTDFRTFSQIMESDNKYEALAASEKENRIRSTGLLRRQ